MHSTPRLPKHFCQLRKRTHPQLVPLAKEHFLPNKLQVTLAHVMICTPLRIIPKGDYDTYLAGPIITNPCMKLPLLLNIS